MSPSPGVLQLLAAPTRHLFLSPHYDDIPLSVGGTVRLLANSGRTPETLIVFGSEPDHSRPLTPFAQAMHEDWGFSARDVIASRRAEEAAAQAILGSMERVLPFRDAIYREDHYLSDDDLFGSPAAAERNLPRDIVASVDLPRRPNSDTRVYAPLAVGRHVDHQLVHRTGTQLAAEGWDVWFYEDIPYSLKPGAFDDRLTEIGTACQIEPVARIPVHGVWDTKLDGILSYPSQLETVFLNYVGVGANRADINAALQEYAGSAGEGELVERFWKLKNAPSGTGS
jgi:LmbE family N-acetylglucosaminyl deacetylase